MGFDVYEPLLLFDIRTGHYTSKKLNYHITPTKKKCGILVTGLPLHGKQKM